MQYVTGAPKILVVDGDRAVLEMLQIRLDVAGYHPLIARTGEAGAAMMRNTRPACAVMDLNLPDDSGLEILDRLTARGTKSIFPILITGRRISREDIVRATKLGARDCLAKPYGGADVLDRVSRLIKVRSPTSAKAIVWV